MLERLGYLIFMADDSLIHLVPPELFLEAFEHGDPLPKQAFIKQIRADGRRVDELKRIFSRKFGESVPNLFEISRRTAHLQSLPLVDECDSPVKPSHVRICLQAISEYSR